MEDLYRRYPGSMTPPPFEQMLVAARERALSAAAFQELREMHDEDLAIEGERREDSMFIDTAAATQVNEAEFRDSVQEPDLAKSSEDEQPLAEDASGPWSRVVVAAVILAVLYWLLSRVS
jgi:hypothetical protein